MIDFIQKKINFNDNIIDVVGEFLKLSHIEIDLAIVEKEILNHPEYPSLVSIVDFFEYFDIEYGTFSPSIEQLIEGFFPCITQLQINGEMYFSIIQSINGDLVKYYDPKLHEFKNVSLAGFGKMYRNLVFMIETSSFEKLPTTKKFIANKFTSKLFLLIFIPVAITVIGLKDYASGATNTLLYYIYNLLSYVGLMVASALVYYEVDNNNVLFRKVCGKSNKNTDCTAVLKSKGAELLGVKFSYIGFCHFSALLIVGIYGNSNIFTTIFPLVSLCISPFIIYSLYYQGVIVKSWCKFCVGIQAILLTQACLFFISRQEIHKISYLLFANYLTIFIATSTLIYIGLLNLVPIFQSAVMYKHVKIGYQKAKFLYNGFWNQLKNQESVSFHNLNYLKFESNKNVDTIVTIVCNPYCTHCSEAHYHIERLYNRGKINFNLVLASSIDKEDVRYLPVRHLLAIAYENNETYFLQAMHDWYITFEQNYQSFIMKYPLPEINELLINNQIQSMNKWCMENEIHFTPTVFVNGYHLSEVYSVDELKYAFD
ncbi:vitamin K epoxide reductase family protein [Mucilaginibacter phyllosphaerae]